MKNKKKLKKDKGANNKSEKLERDYNDTIVISFILDDQLKKEKLASLINLNKKKINENNEKTLKSFEIIEIHLYYEVEKIIKGHFQTLFGKTLNEYGQDWLKLIRLRCQVKKSEERLKYILPKLNKNEKYSKKNI